MLSPHVIQEVSPGIGILFMSSARRLKFQLLEYLTTIEIVAYRAVLLITFLVYAFKHVKAEWLSP